MSECDSVNPDTIRYGDLTRHYEHRGYPRHFAVRFHTRVDHLRDGYGMVLSVPTAEESDAQ